MLSIEEGKDYEDVNEAELPYTLLRNLGHGHSGNVEAVRDEITKRDFARKTIQIPPSRLGKQERLKIFHNEVGIIRGLESHRHIVSVFATYVTKRHFGLILQPVASDGDLEDFLGEYWSLVEEKEGGGIHDPRLEAMALVMQRAFGCLALGLAFIHEKKVRHKDIKPRNVLIHEGLVLYTDFGYSFDSNAFSRSTTEGRPAFLTRKYSAPEVLEQEKRNSKSDVFSLGCVFIDLLYALTMIPEADLHVKCYAESIDDIHKVFESAQISSEYSQIWTIIKEMILQKDSMRLNATQVVDRILVMPNFSCVGCQSGSTETPRNKDSRELNMGESESAKDGQDLIVTKRRINNNSAMTDSHFSDTSETLGAHHQGSTRILAQKDDSIVKPQSPIVGTENMVTVLDVVQRPANLFPDRIPKNDARELEGETVSNDNSQLSKQTRTISNSKENGEEEREDNGTDVEAKATTSEDQEKGTRHDIDSFKSSSASTHDQTKHITMSISSLESLDWTWSEDEKKFYRLAHDEQGKEFRIWARIAPSDLTYAYPATDLDQYGFSTYENSLTPYDGSLHHQAYVLPNHTQSPLPATIQQMELARPNPLQPLASYYGMLVQRHNVSASDLTFTPWSNVAQYPLSPQLSSMELPTSEDKNKVQTVISGIDCLHCRVYLESYKPGKQISRHRRKTEKCKVHSKNK